MGEVAGRGEGSGFRWLRAGHVLTVTLDRPERRNAFDWAMRLGLEGFWTDVAADAGVRCVVVTGAGPGFCAGADVSDLAADRAPRGDGVHDELAFLPGRRLDVPVVVAVNGVCAGGGLHFVADGDVVIAAASASFLDTHVAVGQVSGLEPAALALRAPLGVIGRLALTGRAGRLDASGALAAGLVSEVVDDDTLANRAKELADAIAAASPSAVRATRRVLRRMEARLVEPALEEGWAAVVAHWEHPDAQEGAQAFLERRDPVWEEPAPGQ
ncbi:MAG: enoyl-CoA hydratase-related protein [Acidimicrobiia bacterium]